MKLKLLLPGHLRILHIYLVCSLFILPHTICSAQYRPSLFFREDWKEIPAATPVTQEHVSNQELVLGLYGPGADSIKKSHHASPSDDPFYIWSGLCLENWAVTLRDRNYMVDLTGFAKIIWRTKQQGFRSLHLVLKLADGTWLVSSQSDGLSNDWRLHEFNIMDITWYKLNIKDVCETTPSPVVDLSRVEEIGFTDLMRGGGTKACSRLDWIEVYGKPVKK